MVDHSDNPWQSTPSQLEITRRQIEVWRCRLDQTPGQVEKLGQCLSNDEMNRAEGYRFADKRSQFIVARARLRQCLGQVTGTSAKEIQLTTLESGKPVLAATRASGDIQFNLAHSGSLALIAITRGQPVGVDIEKLRDDLNQDGLARSFFSKAEITALDACPKGSKNEAFFACWTRKEALLKALGAGISYGLDSFDVCIDPTRRHSTTRLTSDPREAGTWQLRTLPCGLGYVAALAFQQAGMGVRFWQ